MRTFPSHSSQLCLQSEAGTLPRNHKVQRNAKRCFGYWNRKSEANLKQNKKSETNLVHECAPGFCIHISVACNEKLARFNVTNDGRVMQNGASFGTRREIQKQTSKTNNL
jgi:hypothetical protein